MFLWSTERSGEDVYEQGLWRALFDLLSTCGSDACIVLLPFNVGAPEGGLEEKVEGLGWVAGEVAFPKGTHLPGSGTGINQ